MNSSSIAFNRKDFWLCLFNGLSWKRAQLVVKQRSLDFNQTFIKTHKYLFLWKTFSFEVLVSIHMRNSCKNHLIPQIKVHGSSVKATWVFISITWGEFPAEMCLQLTKYSVNIFHLYSENGRKIIHWNAQIWRLLTLTSQLIICSKCQCQKLTVLTVKVFLSSNFSNFAVRYDGKISQKVRNSGFILKKKNDGFCLKKNHFFSKLVKVASKFVIEHVSNDIFFIKAYFLLPELSVSAEIRKTLFLEKLSKFAGDVYWESAFNLLKCNFSKTCPWWPNVLFVRSNQIAQSSLSRRETTHRITWTATRNFDYLAVHSFRWRFGSHLRKFFNARYGTSHISQNLPKHFEFF